MSKKTLYIIGAVCLAVLLLIVFLRPRGDKFDKRILLDKNYKAPYGLYVTYNLLPKLFPGANMQVNLEPPGTWYDADSAAGGKSIFFLISEQFNPDEEELGYLYDFVKEGNQVFICTPEMNETAKVYFGFGEEFNYGTGTGLVSDSGQANLLSPPFGRDSGYYNPGFHYTTHFFGVDSLHYTILGKDDSGYPDFIKVNAGKGSFYFHSNPFLFSNYFLLYRNNLNYFQNAVSLMPAGKNKIIWDEYYVYSSGSRGNRDRSTPSPFHVLWDVAAFRWAFSIIILLLLLYIGLGIKMMQRAVPFFAKPKNETLEFTKTIGRLYFEKGDSTNLANKMATYLLEYVRNRYFIKTTYLNEDFIINLVNKSGCEEQDIRAMVDNLAYIQQGNKVTQKQLADIYTSFSKFYKHTS